MTAPTRGILQPKCPRCGAMLTRRDDTADQWAKARDEVVLHTMECPSRDGQEPQA